MQGLLRSISFFVSLPMHRRRFFGERKLLSNVIHCVKASLLSSVEDGAQIEFMYHYTLKSLEFRHLSETLFAQESVDKIRLRTLRAEDFRAGFMKSKCLGQIEI